MSDERKPPDRGMPFEGMAARIRANAAADFGGAFVVVPPGDNDPVAYLTLDSRQDPAMFWANIKAIAELTISEMDEKQRRQYGGVR